MATRNQPKALYSIDALQEFSGWLLDLQEQSTAVELEQFPRKVLESLKQFIPHQASSWGGGHMAAGTTVLHFLYQNDLDPATLVAWEAHKNKIASTVNLMSENAGQAFTFSASLTPDDPQFTLIHGPHGIRDILSIFLSDERRGLCQKISMFRTDGVAFSEAERGLFQAAAIHLARALRSCQIAHVKRLNKSPLVSLAAMAIVDMEGILHFAEDRLVASLRTEWPGWKGPWLPPDAWEILAKDEEPQQRQFTGRRIVLTLAGKETLRLLSVRPKLAIDDLSAREREVACLFASGLKHKEIARRLDVAPSTIRTQLNSIYTKLGINDKGALSAYLNNFLSFSERTAVNPSA